MTHYVLDEHGRYQVTAPCVVARLVSGKESYAYRGDFLPPNTRLDQINHLVTLGAIKEIKQ